MNKKEIVENKELKDFKFSLGRRLAALRTDNHYSLKEVVNKMQLSGIDITEKTLSHYECATSKIDIFKLSKVAEFYGVTTDYLLYGTESTPVKDFSKLIADVPEKLQPHLINMVKNIVNELHIYSAEN